MRPSPAALTALLLPAAAFAAAWPTAPGPVNDDWQMHWSARHFAETGEVRNLPYSAMGLAGWTVLGGPMWTVTGGSFAAMRLLPMALHCAASLAAYLGARRLGAERTASLLVALTVALCPIPLWLATTFQSDAGWHAAWVGAVAAFAHGLRGGSGRAFALGAVLAAWAAWVRSPAAALPLALGAAVFAAPVEPRVRRMGVAAAAFALIAGNVAFELWYRNVHGPTPAYAYKASASIAEMVRAVPAGTFAALCYGGLLAAPLLFFGGPPSRGEAVAGAAGAAVALVQAKTGFLAVAKSMPYLPNVLHNFGVGPLTLTDLYREQAAKPAALPGWLQVVAGAACAAAGGVFAVRLVRALRSARTDAPTAFLGAAIVLYGGGAILFSRESAPLFDRYVAPLVFPAALLLLPRGGAAEQVRPRAAWRWLVAASLVGIACIRDFHRFQCARYALADDAAARAGNTRIVDGGFEFDAWHNYEASVRGEFVTAAGWKGWLVEDPVWVVAAHERPGYEVARRERVFLVAGMKSFDLLLLRRK